ncbi:hypothetical protein BCR41DRAFT_345677 [Lobosporangium transversale]|uniref:Uncharacterized protein n=1 Tax=Lobosporangium transversale TaxID=64571 RepID=A0A1Y2GZD5_9FUNG|nr:hypothetical protein BCR41DRAFT_345677 [Lobosporangium transversale]ORZ27668.1 hypothetical protein BCR41DRAFT_345677 [Lobosporangium transversale]|eukprot:XP_021885371.1 hypothetical protein BCR41DRAFT_345677 [Lobosporangium transversale]
MKKTHFLFIFFSLQHYLGCVLAPNQFTLFLFLFLPFLSFSFSSFSYFLPAQISCISCHHHTSDNPDNFAPHALQPN